MEIIRAIVADFELGKRQPFITFQKGEEHPEREGTVIEIEEKMIENELVIRVVTETENGNIISDYPWMDVKKINRGG